MAELSYPSAGGGSVTDTRYEMLIGSATPSGVIQSVDGLSLVYADSTGRQIKVRASRAAVVRGYRWESDGAGIIRAIAANTSGQARIDLAVLRLNRADWTVTFQVITGTPSATPIAPAYTQAETTTGVWELPLASIAVANGAATITSGQVVDRAPTLGGWNYEGNNGNFPPAIGSSMSPQFYYANDTNRQYAAINGSYSVIGEAGAAVGGTASTGWTTSAFLRRWNGFVWMQALCTRTGTTLTANTASDMFVIPSAYRPLMDMFLVGYAGGTAMRCYIDASSGVCSLNAYTINFGTNAALNVHPATWPANNL